MPSAQHSRCLPRAVRHRKGSRSWHCSYGPANRSQKVSLHLAFSTFSKPHYSIKCISTWCLEINAISPPMMTRSHERFVLIDSGLALFSIDGVPWCGVTTSFNSQLLCMNDYEPLISYITSYISTLPRFFQVALPVLQTCQEGTLPRIAICDGNRSLCKSWNVQEFKVCFRQETLQFVTCHQLSLQISWVKPICYIWPCMTMQQMIVVMLTESPKQSWPLSPWLKPEFIAHLPVKQKTSWSGRSAVKLHVDLFNRWRQFTTDR